MSNIQNRKTVGITGLLLSVMLGIAASALAATPSTQPAEFLRYVENGDGSARLESADVAYRNSAGVVVHLIGALHIADTEYYAGLNESFEHYDALLYELITPAAPDDANARFIPPRPGSRGAASREGAAAPQGGSSLAWVGNLQRFMKDRLKLSFQLEEIDYGRKNFVHADLDAETFAKLQADRGESMLGLMLRSALQGMSKGGADVSGLQLLAALFSPDQARELKRILAQQFADLDGMMDSLDGPNGSVILGERNKVALSVLRQQMARGKKYLGIFYGAGHLKLMEKSLTEMGFHRVGVTWRTAWDIAAPTAPPTTRPIGMRG